MTWWYAVAFSWGFAFGVVFAITILSRRRKKWRKADEEHAAMLLEQAKRQDEMLLASFKKQYQELVADYQKKIDDLYLKEFLIEEGYPQDEEVH